MVNRFSPNDRNIVVLISAAVEWRTVRALFCDANIQRSPYGEWFYTQINSPEENTIESRKYSVIFFQGGWGKISGAGSTQYVIDYWNPELLINLGTCGGFEGDIERGTIILVEKTIVYDIYELMVNSEEHLDHYTTKIDLSWLEDKYPTPVLRTHLVSGDRDLMVNEISQLKTKYQALAGDWESGAIAYIAAINGVRTLILRGVTDLIGTDGGEAYGNIELFEENAQKIMRELINQLPLWIKISNIG